jgi:O-antigen/teichoic acid export membrane protein
MSGAGAPGLGRRLARNTLHAASGRFAAILVWLLFTPMVLRGLGAEGFAVWALFFALTGQLSSLDFGLVQGTLRHVASARERDQPDEAGAFASLALLGYLVLALLWIALLAVFGDSVIAWLRVPPDQLHAARFALWMGAGVFALAGAANVVMAVAQAHGRFDIANAVTLTLTAQHAIGIPIVMVMGWGVRGLVLNVALGWMLGLALGLILLPRAAPGFRWAGPRRSLQHAAEAARFGGPMQLTAAMWMMNQQVDKFLLARFVALAAVTPYELGARVALSAATFPQMLLGAALPTASALHAAGDLPRLRELHDSLGRYMLVVTAMLMAMLIGSADRLYAVWLGPGHADAAHVLRWLAVAYGILLTTGPASVMARGIGRTGLETWFHVIGLSVHVGLSLWLLPRMGLSGVLIASAAGYLAGTVLFISLVTRTMGWSHFNALVRPHVVPALAAIAGALASLALNGLLPAGNGPLRWALLASVAACGGVVAVAVALLSGYIRAAEVRYLLGRRA